MRQIGKEEQRPVLEKKSQCDKLEKKEQRHVLEKKSQCVKLKKIP